MTRGLRTAAPLLCAIILASFASAQELPAARQGLRAVPLPDLTALETPVADQLRSAQRELERAIERRTGSSTLATAYGSFGRLLHAYELFDGAESAYQNAATLASADGRWPYLLGYLFQQTGRLTDAESQFTRALRLEPARRETAARLADVYLRLNRLRESREQFQALRDLFPAVAAQGLGDVALREGRLNDAVQHFRDALTRMPQATAVHYSLAMAYRGLGRLEDARTELDRRGSGVITLGDPEVESLRALVRGERLLTIRGKAAFEAGQFRDAASWFASAIADAPEAIAARVNLGTTYIRLGEPDKAIEQFEMVMRLNPDDDETATNLAILLADRSRFADAIAVLKTTRARVPRSTPVATTLARLLAASPDRSVRNGAEALALAEEVFAASPSPVHAETVALALTELGRCADAHAWLLRAVAAAEQAVDVAEVERLRALLARYSSPACR
jgi:Flp pilus assembly protein TadD